MAARVLTAGAVALQGNMDPGVLLSSPEAIMREAKRILATYGDAPGHVFNLGHGIWPTTPPEHVRVLVDTVHEETERGNARLA